MPKWFRPSKEEQEYVDKYRKSIDEKINDGMYQRDAEQEALQEITEQKNNNTEENEQ